MTLRRHRLKPGGTSLANHFVPKGQDDCDADENSHGDEERVLEGPGRRKNLIDRGAHCRLANDESGGEAGEHCAGDGRPNTTPQVPEPCFELKIILGDQMQTSTMAGTAGDNIPGEEEMVSDEERLEQALPFEEYGKETKKLKSLFQSLEKEYDKREKVIAGIMKFGTGIESEKGLRMYPTSVLEKWRMSLESFRREQLKKKA